MKKFFTLIAATLMAVCASAQADFSWSSTGPEGVVAVNGTVSYQCGDGTNRVNYANIIGDVTYYTICLAGKKANMGGETDSKGDSGYALVTLNNAIAAGDKIIMTAYYNKGEDKDVSAYMLFENGAEFTTTPGDFPDIKDARQASEPKTVTYEIPAAAIGSKTIKMTRDKASTNLFITKLIIGTESGIKNIAADAKNAKAYNLAAQVVDASYRGVVIKNGKKMIQK